MREIQDLNCIDGMWSCKTSHMNRNAPHLNVGVPLDVGIKISVKD
jgi:hypothetical protein